MKILLLILCVSAFVFSSSAQTKVRVKFAKNASEATLKGHLTGYNYVDYLVSGKAGQTMSVNLAATTNDNLEIYLYKGVMESLEDSAGGKEWTGALPENGNYTIRVILPRSAARRKGAAASFSVKISVQ